MSESTRPAAPGEEAGQSGQSKKIANGLVALSSAAILAVYAAGYVRTRPAAERFAAAAARRKPFIPAPARPEASRVVPPLALDVGKAVVESAPADTRKPPAVEATPAAAASPAAKKAISVSPSPTGSGTPSPTPTVVAKAAPSPVPTEVPPPPSATPAPAATLADSTVAGDGNGSAADPVAAPTPAEPARYKDGTYHGYGWCRHGFLNVTVVVEYGLISAIDIEECATRYPCGWIAELPPQVINRQSLDVKKVTGATDSTYAFVEGVYEALLKAQ